MIKQLFKNFIGFCSHKEKNYPLIFQEAVIKNNELICIFTARGEITPFKLPIDKVLSAKNVLYNISPETLLFLKELQFKHCNNRPVSSITSLERDNMYSVNIDDRILLLSGKDICKDLSLLSSFKMHDAFNIIYNTAYLTAHNDFKQKPLQKKDNIKKTTVVKLKLLK